VAAVVVAVVVVNRGNPGSLESLGNPRSKGISGRFGGDGNVYVRFNEGYDPCYL
jgi:hypothetical protein